MRVFLLSLCTKLNFVGIPVRKIMRIYCVSISRPGDLELRPLTLKLVRIISREMDILRTNFGVARMLSANTCQTRHVTLRP